MALINEGAAGNNKWMDVLLGKMPMVTADLIRKAFYSADEQAATASLCQFIISVIVEKEVTEANVNLLIKEGSTKEA